MQIEKIKKIFQICLQQSFFIFILASLFLAPSKINAEVVALSSQDVQWMARMIYKNECDLKSQRLTTWNEGEDFASIGIGHFIWYPKGETGLFRESFPEFIDYLKLIGREAPVWVSLMVEDGMPWKNKKEFNNERFSDRMERFRYFLESNIDAQILFIIDRFRKSITQMIKVIPAEEQDQFLKKILALSQTRNGIYAMTDYVNFKGDGLSATERYRGHGWGLLQVLEEMNWPLQKHSAEEEFMFAAKRVLERRVVNSPFYRGEKKWLRGWKNRVETYTHQGETPFFSTEDENSKSPLLHEGRTIEVLSFSKLSV